MGFEPRDPDFEQRTRANFASQGFMRWMDASLSRVEPGLCELHLGFDPQLAQQHGFFHGGVIATLADVSGGYAAFSLLAEGRTNVTVELKVNLLAPGQGPALIARGLVLKPGRTLTVCRSDVFVIGPDGGERLCATALATYMALDPPSTDR